MSDMDRARLALKDLMEAVGRTGWHNHAKLVSGRRERADLLNRCRAALGSGDDAQTLSVLAEFAQSVEQSRWHESDPIQSRRDHRAALVRAAKAASADAAVTPSP